MIKLSIITPTYKRQNDLIKNYLFLRKNINFYNFEWILLYEIDDYKTLAAINFMNEKFVKKYPGYYKNADKAFSFGLKKAVGNFVIIHGDDDFFEKNFFFNIKKISYSNSWIVGLGYYINDKNKIIKQCITYVKSLFIKKYSFYTLTIINYIMSPSVIFNKKIANKLVSKQRINYIGADYFLWLKFAKFYKPKIINYFLSYSKISKNTLTGSFDIKRYLIRLNILKLYANNIITRFFQYIIIISLILYHFINKKIFKNI